MIGMFYWSYCKAPVFWQNLMELELQEIFEIHTNMKFHENSSSGSRGVTGGQTERLDAFRSFVNKLKINLTINYCVGSYVNRINGGLFLCTFQNCKK